MHSPKEARRILDHYRQRRRMYRIGCRGKVRNGSTGWLDDIGLDKLVYNSKKRYARKGKKNVYQRLI